MAFLMSRSCKPSCHQIGARWLSKSTQSHIHLFLHRQLTFYSCHYAKLSWQTDWWSLQTSSVACSSAGKSEELGGLKNILCWDNTVHNDNDCLVGLVVKACASRVEDPGFESRLRWHFSGLSHTSDIKIDTPVATLPGVWCYRVSAGTGRTGVSILWLGEVESLICNFYLSVAANSWDVKQPTNKQTTTMTQRGSKKRGPSRGGGD